MPAFCSLKIIITMHAPLYYIYVSFSKYDSLPTLPFHQIITTTNNSARVHVWLVETNMLGAANFGVFLLYLSANYLFSYGPSLCLVSPPFFSGQVLRYSISFYVTYYCCFFSLSTKTRLHHM